MKRSELVRQVALQTGLAPAAADAAVRAALEAVAGALARGEAVRCDLWGSGRSACARPGRNSATGASIVVPASRSVSFRAGKGGLRDAVNRTAGAVAREFRCHGGASGHGKAVCCCSASAHDPSNMSKLTMLSCRSTSNQRAE